MSFELLVVEVAEERLEAAVLGEHRAHLVADRRGLGFEIGVPREEAGVIELRRRQIREIQEFRTLRRIRITRRKLGQIDREALLDARESDGAVSRAQRRQQAGEEPAASRGDRAHRVQHERAKSGRRRRVVEPLARALRREDRAEVERQRVVGAARALDRFAE
ncbi:MAG TPA: hypothetical protein VLK83_00595, partial [Rhodanobacteraceae bacterium]|nr:hypothetical protein [Rhodanobacteraceae bacterium]